MKTLTSLAVSLGLATAALAQSPAETATKTTEPNPDLPPIGAIHAHVCGIHFYSGNIKRQLIAQHYCAHLSDEVLQCIIYDSEQKDARADIPDAKLDPGADAWQKGAAVQLDLKTVSSTTR